MLNDEKYMRMALSLARKGCGLAAPNPMVGAVIVKEGRVIGRGYHQKTEAPMRNKTHFLPVRSRRRGQ